jgi:hypothetical protein
MHLPMHSPAGPRLFLADPAAAQALGLEARLRQASLSLQGTQALELTDLQVSVGGLQCAGARQRLLHLQSLQLRHAHSHSPGLGWLAEPGWQLERVSCALGTVTLEAGPEAAAALLPLVLAQAGGSPRRRKSGAGGKGMLPVLVHRLPREVRLQAWLLRLYEKGPYSLATVLNSM